MNRQFVVVGLGRLGISMVATLDDLDHEVLGIDNREDVVQEVADDLPNVNLVAADATGKIHARVLERVGADRVIQPELEIGEQLARTMASPALLDYVDFGEDEALIEARVPPEWLDKSLAELALSHEKGLTIVALKPRGGPGILPHGDTVLQAGDVLVVGGSKEALNRSPLVRPSDH
jgi:trk system potassium uptake protein TrkA